MTEDAEIGLRLKSVGANIQIVYDEKHVTHEETPDNLGSFVKQRTRWNQGFIQILAKGEWKKLPNLKQKLLTAYLLLSPILQIVFMLYSSLKTKCQIL